MPRSGRAPDQRRRGARPDPLRQAAGERHQPDHRPAGLGQDAAPPTVQLRPRRAPGDLPVHGIGAVREDHPLRPDAELLQPQGDRPVDLLRRPRRRGGRRRRARRRDRTRQRADQAAPPRGSARSTASRRWPRSPTTRARSGASSTTSPRCPRRSPPPASRSANTARTRRARRPIRRRRRHHRAATERVNERTPAVDPGGQAARERLPLGPHARRLSEDGSRLARRVRDLAPLPQRHPAAVPARRHLLRPHRHRPQVTRERPRPRIREFDIRSRAASHRARHRRSARRRAPRRPGAPRPRWGWARRVATP